MHPSWTWIVVPGALALAACTSTEPPSPPPWRTAIAPVSTRDAVTFHGVSGHSGGLWLGWDLAAGVDEETAAAELERQVRSLPARRGLDERDGLLPCSQRVAQGYALAALWGVEFNLYMFEGEAARNERVDGLLRLVAALRWRDRARRSAAERQQVARDLATILTTTEDGYLLGATLREVDALGADGLPALDGLARVLRSTAAPWLRARASRAIGGLGAAGAPAIPELLRTLDGPDDHRHVARLHAAAALVLVGADPARPLATLAEGLSLPGALDETALRLVGTLGERGASLLPRIEAIAREPACHSHALAAATFARIGGDPDVAAGLLLAALRASGDPFGKVGVFMALRSLGPAAPRLLPSFIEELRAPDVDRRVAAVDAVAQLGATAEPAVPALLAVKAASPALTTIVDEALESIRTGRLYPHIYGTPYGTGSDWSR